MKTKNYFKLSMKIKTLLTLLLLIIVSSCAKRETRTMVNSGDYDKAIKIAVKQLQDRKDAKRKQDYIYILEEAFAKAKDQDIRNINTWFNDTNPENLERIFETYKQLNNRQELIRPLLPLKLINEKRNAIFPFDDYTEQIVSSKKAFAKHLYENAKALLATSDKINFRRAYDDLLYLKSLTSDFNNIDNLIDEAKNKGTDFVNVFTKNETNMIIPIRLQNDLLDFSTFGLNDKWTVYHSNRLQNINYDYGLIVNFREINISPEQIKEKEIIKEKQIKDGVKNLLDNNGNIVKDSLGRPIKVDNFKTVRATIYEFRQFKSAQVVAKVDYIDFNNNQLIDTFPISSEFIFEHIYATYSGDKRACDDNYLNYFNNRAVPFPSNEQMVYDCGEDLKAKLKGIITRNKFRR